MILCPNCQNEEYPGALFCGKCGAQLTQPEDEKSTTAIYTSIPDAGTHTQIPPFPDPPKECADASVALIIVETKEVVFLHSSEDFSLGRATAGQPIVPDIDLTPFNAYETGVSRLHASINIVKDPITVQDLGSVNGTRVNGKKLSPHSTTSISNGDIITLGKLKIQILIKE
jgi:hypothetical protein